MALGQYVWAGSSVTKWLYHLDSSGSDSSGNGYTWTTVNCSFGLGSIGSGSVTLNGSNAYVDMGNVMNFDYNTPFTISLKLRNEMTAGSNIVSKQQNGWAYHGYGLGTDASWTLQFFLYAGGGSGSFIANFPSSYNDGKFHQIDCTYDGSNTFAGIKLYVDGQEVVKTTINNIAFSVSLSTTASFQISGRWGWNNVCKWWVDELIVENVVRDASYVVRKHSYSLWRFATL